MFSNIMKHTWTHRGTQWVQTYFATGVRPRVKHKTQYAYSKRIVTIGLGTAVSQPEEKKKSISKQNEKGESFEPTQTSGVLTFVEISHA